MDSATAASQTTLWAAEDGQSDARGGAARPPGLSPRPLEARALVTIHHILVQLADAGLRPRFAETCRAFGDIVWCDDLDDLVAGSRAREALAAVVDVVDRDGCPTAPAVAAIRRNRPHLPIVLWCDRLAAAGRIDAIAAAGVSAIAFRAESDFEGRLLGALTRATDVTFQQLTDQALARRVPEALVPAVRLILDRAAAPPPHEAMGRTVGLTTAELAGALRRAGLPPVARLVSWSRLLTAAYRLERTAEPIAEVARSVGFTTTASLSRQLKRYTNETARSIREPGGFGWALRCFERYLSRPRRRG